MKSILLSALLIGSVSCGTSQDSSSDVKSSHHYITLDQEAVVASPNSECQSTRIWSGHAVRPHHLNFGELLDFEVADATVVSHLKFSPKAQSKAKLVLITGLYDPQWDEGFDAAFFRVKTKAVEITAASFSSETAEEIPADSLTAPKGLFKVEVKSQDPSASATAIDAESLLAEIDVLEEQDQRSGDFRALKNVWKYAVLPEGTKVSGLNLTARWALQAQNPNRDNIQVCLVW